MHIPLKFTNFFPFCFYEEHWYDTKLNTNHKKVEIHLFDRKEKASPCILTREQI